MQDCRTFWMCGVEHADDVHALGLQKMGTNQILIGRCRISDRLHVCVFVIYFVSNCTFSVVQRSGVFMHFSCNFPDHCALTILYVSIAMFSLAQCFNFSSTSCSTFVAQDALQLQDMSYKLPCEKKITLLSCSSLSAVSQHGKWFQQSWYAIKWYWIWVWHEFGASRTRGGGAAPIGTCFMGPTDLCFLLVVF